MKTHNRPNVTRAMKVLRLEHRWTLQEIADIFGVTREAIRLRVGNTGHFSPPSEGRGRKSPPKEFVDAEEVFRRLGL